MQEKSLCGRAPADITRLQLQVVMQVIIMLQDEAPNPWEQPTQVAQSHASKHAKISLRFYT